MPRLALPEVFGAANLRSITRPTKPAATATLKPNANWGTVAVTDSVATVACSLSQVSTDAVPLQA